MYFDSHKITVHEFIEKLSKRLISYGFKKSFIKKYCSELKREIKRELRFYKPCGKRKNTKKKSDTHLFKSNQEFRIGVNKVNINSNESIELNYLFYENLVMELKGCKIVDKNSIFNLVKLIKLLPYLENKYRFNEFRWVFSILDIEILDIIRYIINNGAIRDTNLTIWSNGNTTQKATSIIVSISSKANEELCNLELWNKGFEQIYERLPKDLALKLALKMYITKCSYEFGNSSNESKEFFQKLGYDFIEKRIYKIYGLKYWLDCSRGGVELEFKHKGYYTDICRMLKLIEEFKLYVKGILTMNPFSLENNNTKNDFTKKAKGRYKVIVFLKRVKFFFTWIIPIKKSKT